MPPTQPHPMWVSGLFGDLLTERKLHGRAQSGLEVPIASEDHNIMTVAPKYSIRVIRLDKLINVLKYWNEHNLISSCF